MNRNQWFVFGIGSMILSSFLFMSTTGSYCNALILNDAQITACFVKRYAYAIPAIIFHFLSWVLIICGFLESKNKK